MEDDVLKGNFKVKRPVQLNNEKKEGTLIRDELKKKALSSIGGSMVYMERNDLTWDGDQ